MTQLRVNWAEGWWGDSVSRRSAVLPHSTGKHKGWHCLIAPGLAPYLLPPGFVWSSQACQNLGHEKLLSPLFLQNKIYTLKLFSHTAEMETENRKSQTTESGKEGNTSTQTQFSTLQSRVAQQTWSGSFPALLQKRALVHKTVVTDFYQLPSNKWYSI